MVERLLGDPEEVLHFDDKTLISNYRLPRNRNWNSITETNKSVTEHYWLKCK